MNPLHVNANYSSSVYMFLIVWSIVSRYSCLIVYSLTSRLYIFVVQFAALACSGLVDCEHGFNTKLLQPTRTIRKLSTMIKNDQQGSTGFYHIK